MKALRNLLIQPFLIVLLLVTGGMLSGAHALEVPPLKGRVNDTARILSSSSVQMLEQTLQALEQKESTQIVVLTIPSLEGESLEPYTLKVVETWKIGQKGTDNGALLFIAAKDRKIRIETGYGLEGKLTDLVAGRIIRETMVPAFRQGNYDQGVIDGVGAMVAVVKGEYTGRQVVKKQQPRRDPGGFVVFLIIGLAVIGSLFSQKKPVAAVAGGVFAPMAALFLSGFSGWLPFALLIPGGILGALIASTLAGSGGGNRFGPGGFFSGGSIGGGGGFGGFSGGGGSFGGGGASGEW